MKKRFLLAAAILLSGLFTAERAQAQFNNWAVGFRLGEPAGLNVRKYFGENHAFDVNIGTYGGVYANVRSYRQGYYRNVGLAIQGHYLWHGDVGSSQTLHYYYGFGGQVGSRRYFPRNLSGQRTDYVNNISLGGSGVGGVEYFMPNKTTSIFLEAGLYAEVLPQPLFFNVQSGIGLRFNL
ncbi:hypothetical protein [Tellurirhabdus rosea]|uniref:hypothetical protein n=1 Tax=Tellurirhabdus rosea TaxID=2674997 RepID=UPI00225994F1|nr:hypothetical protein [Tellurirhabdus rosea]